MSFTLTNASGVGGVITSLRYFFHVTNDLSLLGFLDARQGMKGDSSV
ncbi:hypothetical protein Xets_03504 [Xenorhabdus sp. TS4]|nr:hypothetical protein [Xenorhabdus sp. TS4]MBC8950725.1 hypothetical protein [Xenorhabdus sp. TS4]